MSVQLPEPRGPLSEHVIGTLGGASTIDPAFGIPAADPLSGEDLQLALYLAYELHYAGFDGIDPGGSGILA